MITWTLCFITNLLIPLTMIFFGKAFSKKAPENINSIFGYRTNMSMKNQETWDFAHKYFGVLWLRAGLAILPFAVIPMLCVLKKDVGVIGVTGEVTALWELLAMLIPIIPTEKALRKNFDKNGNRKGE